MLCHFSTKLKFNFLSNLLFLFSVVMYKFFSLYFSHSVVVGNAKNIKEKVFLISGNEEFLCVAHIPNTVKGV